MGHTLAALVAVLTLTAAPAFAGIVDSPLPVLDPAAKTIHLYSVPGVVSDLGTTLGTFFSCTSTASSPVTVGVEVFPSAGGPAMNNASTTSLVAAPGSTVTFATVNPASGVDSNLGTPTFVSVKWGSARILATSKSLVCTAWVAEANTGTPTVAYDLTIIAKTKQKAAN